MSKKGFAFSKNRPVLFVLKKDTVMSSMRLYVIIINLVHSLRVKMKNKELTQLAVDIQQGLQRLGPDRVVALSVHKTKELIAELDAKATQLASELSSADQ